jgi:transposase-like protein
MVAYGPNGCKSEMSRFILKSNNNNNNTRYACDDCRKVFSAEHQLLQHHRMSGHSGILEFKTID